MRLEDLPGYDPNEPILAVVDWAKREHGLDIRGGRQFGLDPLVMLFIDAAGSTVVATHDATYRSDPWGVAADLLFHIEATGDMRRRRS
jgi:hypothetical protein